MGGNKRSSFLEEEMLLDGRMEYKRIKEESLWLLMVNEASTMGKEKK